jgi:RimJ/RimL family protein N-acetyltransferase
MDFDFLELTQCLECSFSERIALRPVALCDAWPVYIATRNPAFNKHLLWAQPDCEEQVLKRIRLIMDAARMGKLTALSAVLRRTGEFVALFRFQPHASRPDAIEMGVWVHDRFWHGRYSLELGRLCVSGAFALSNVELLLGASSPENRGSCHLMEAVGMVPSQMVSRPTEMGYDAILREYTITRSEWAAQHATAFSLVSDDRVERRVPEPQLVSQPMPLDSQPMPLEIAAATAA